MVDRVIRIVLDANDLKRGLTDVKGRLDKTEQSAKKTGESMRALRQVAGGLVAAFGIRELTRAADTFTNIGNRIRLVTDGTAEYNRVQDELVGLAQRTRSDLEATVELYARVARSTDALGASQQEVLTFTESVNQALQISGATAAEAGAGVIQFAQGLASGALRGDELRSVLEQTPRLAQALADNLGVSIGELRKLGEAGELSAEKVFAAILKAGPELQAEFDQITPTIEQTLTTMRTFFTTIVGTFNETAGITAGLSDIFTLTDESTKNLADSVRDLALNFREFIEVATVAVVNLVEQVAPAFGAVEAEIIKVIAAITRDEELFRAAFEGQNEFIDQLDNVKAKLDAELEAIRLNNEERRKAFEDRGAGLDERGAGGAGGVIDPDAAKAAAELIKQQEKLLESLQQQEAALALSQQAGIDYAQALLQIKIETLGAGEAGAAFRFDATETAAEIRRLQKAIEDEAQAEQDLADRRAEAAQITLDARTETQKLADEVQRLQGFLDEGLISQEVFDASVENLSTLDDSLQDFFRRARENSQDILAGFLESGLQDIDDFAQAFSEMLLALASQALAAEIFKSLFGSGTQGGGTDTAGLLTSVLSIFGGGQFGRGVQAGQPVNVAEGGRFGGEIFVPNQGGRIEPVGADRSGPGMAMAAPEVNTTIVNTIDESDITGAFQGGAGDSVLLNRISVKRTAFRRALGV